MMLDYVDLVTGRAPSGAPAQSAKVLLKQMNNSHKFILGRSGLTVKKSTG